MSDSARHKSPFLPGDIVVGKYRVDRVIGAGGMGVVLAATHLELEQGVALKFILPGLLAGKAAVERFMREARAAVRLKSEHVARVLDVGRDAEDRPFMVLELLEGEDLSTTLSEGGPLAPADAVEYVLQACEALVEAHGLGIVHRDLKPQNLFVTRRVNGSPLIKVLDFGIAKAIGPAAAGQMALTDSAAIIGSPLYMAPEQMRSARNVDVRSDIWALGVILYEALAGRVPFGGETVTEICIRVVNEEPPPLRDVCRGIPDGLADAVMRCLAKDPNARYSNVGELALALEPFGVEGHGGGRARAFRSFVATGESVPPRVVIAASPDDTGPSTALTVASDRPPAASSTGPSATGPRSGSRTLPPLSSPPAPIVSTGTSWVGGSGHPSPDVAVTPRRRGAAVAGAFAVLALVAGVGGVVLGRLSDPAPETSASPVPSAVPMAVPAAAPAASVVARAPDTLADASAGASGASADDAQAVVARAATSGSAPRPPGAGARGRPSSPRHGAHPPATTPAVVEPAAAVPAGPAPANGAPILR